MRSTCEKYNVKPDLNCANIRSASYLAVSFLLVRTQNVHRIGSVEAI